MKEDDNCASLLINHKGGEDAYSTNPKKVKCGKSKTRNEDVPKDYSTGANTCMVHDPGNSSKDYFFLIGLHVPIV